MTTASKTLIDLETNFWQSMVDQDTAAALKLLHDPACMATAHGAMKFDHAGYRKMAEQGSMVVTSFALSDVEVMFPTETTAVLTYRVKQSVGARDGGNSTTQDMSGTSTWVHVGNRWQCVLHTEAPMDATSAKH
ncbi:MAG: nuclear transport factor 2 family protein [Rhizobacter sp.]|nr:nuclear transport factor 2 family protein [Rhizobacter sp.]